MRIRALARFAVLSLAAGLAGCGGREVDAAPVTAAPTPPDTALLGAEALRIAGLALEPVTSAAWREEWTAPGRLTLDPASTQPLGAIVEGRVVRVLSLPGDRVRTGQVLATLHSHEMLDALGMRAAARAALVRAANEARLAASAADRAERLYAAKALSLADLERARAATVDAEAMRMAAVAEAERAEEMVAHMVGRGPVPRGIEPHEVLVRSPMDGVVVAREAQPGQVVVVGTPLLTVSRLSTLRLVLHLPEAALGAAQPGANVRFMVKSNPSREWHATVTRAAPAIDATTRTVEVWAGVDDPSGELRPEMFATARVSQPAAGSPTLTVPDAAVQTLDGGHVVIAAEQRGEGLHLRAVPVRLGRRSAAVAEVLAGVEEGTLVVGEGAAIARAEILRRREAGSEGS